MHVSKNEPKRISVAEAARVLDVDPRTVARMIRRGELRGEKVYEGLRAPFLVPRADVDRVLRERAKATVSGAK